MRGKVMAADTAGYALKFGLTAIPSALRLGWLPLLLSVVGGYLLETAGGEADFCVNAEFETSTVTAEWGGNVLIPAESADPVALGIGGVLVLLSVVLLVPLMVLWTRMAARQVEAPGGFFYFRWGGREWRVVGMFFFLMVWMMLILMICILPSIGVAFATGLDLNMVEEMDLDGADLGPAIIAFTVGMLVFSWAMIRSSLMMAVPALENRFAPLYAFGLTGGNFWKIVLASVLMGLAVILIFFPLGLLLVGLSALLIGLTGFEFTTLSGIAALAVILPLGGLLDLYGNLVGVGYSGRLWQAITLTEDYSLNGD